MDSDIYFKENRPHALLVDQDLLYRLLTDGEFGTKFRGSSRPRKADLTDDSLTLINHSVNFGLIFPEGEQYNLDGFLENIEIPVLMKPADDPTLFDVFLKSSDANLSSESQPAKRRRITKKKFEPQPQKLLFSLQVLDGNQFIRDQISLLYRTYPKKIAIKIQPPRLELHTSRTENGLSIEACISYSLQVENSTAPLGVFAMKSSSIAALFRYVTGDPLFGWSLSQVQPTVDANMFYKVISQPKDLKTLKHLPVPGFESHLLRYQMESVRWLLRREGKDIIERDGDVDILDLDPEIRSHVVSPPSGWRQVNINVGNENKQIWANPYSGSLCSEEKLNNELRQAHEKEARGGGILAEEMGLGKTVEIIALILLNQRMKEQIGEQIYDAYAARTATKSKTTLIISPASISRQWMDELQQHAPGLKCFYYRGVKKNKGLIRASDLAQYDVIVTHYHIIATEVHYALFNPEARKTRQSGDLHPDLEALRSPLMQTEFWRIILDEAQMVASGVSAAAKVAKLIPRVHAWAVTGTPVKKNMDDLSGLLSFMRHPVFSESNLAWRQLMASTEDFCQLFSHMSIRHTAHMVRNDIRIPRQHRISVHLLFNSIEETNYKQLYRDFLADLRLVESSDGSIRPLDNSDLRLDLLDSGKLAQWFQRLRQACSHPRVGSGNRRAFGGNLLRTMTDLLDGMLENATSSLYGYRRSYYVSVIEKGQVFEIMREPSKAWEIWSKGLHEINEIVAELREEVMQAKKAQLAKNNNPDINEAVNVVEDIKEEDEEEENEAVRDMRARLRSWLEVLHRYYFFVATANFQMLSKQLEKEASLQSDVKVEEELKPKTDEQPLGEKTTEPLSLEAQKFKDEEKKYYELAELLRRELLRDAIVRVEKTTGRLKHNIKKIKDDVAELGVGDAHEMLMLSKRLDLSFKDRVLLMGRRLNQQARLINEWRQELSGLLKGNLVDQNADPDGEEYGESLDDQEKAFCYLEVLQQMMSDRAEAITGTSDPIVSKAERFERTKTKNSRDSKLEISDQGDIANTNKKLRLEISETQKSSLQVDAEVKRRQCNPVHQRSLSEIVSSWKEDDNDCGEINDDDRAELQSWMSSFKDLLTNSTKETNALNREIATFRVAYNARVAYYKQLQELSDSVTSLFPEGTTMEWPEAHEMIRGMESYQEELTRHVHQDQSRITYLNSLRKNDDQLSEEDRKCVICQDDIFIGSLTVCGHRFCRACLQQWFAHRNSCPVCKTRLEPNQIHNFTLKKGPIAEVDVREDNITSQNESENERRTNPIYKEVSRDILNDILTSKEDDSMSLYGTKIDIILRHLSWLREKDASCQVVIFSQWAEMLDLLDYVLTYKGIKHASVKSHMNEFKKDTDYACFLLHAKNESAGLTLVNATHVYLCEPLINTTLEVQAISRIHRIGQTKPTTVWLFVIRDTIEEAVLKLSTEKRLEYLKDNENSAKSAASEPLTTEDIEVGNSHELTKSVAQMMNKNVAGGEIVHRDDLCKVLITYHERKFASK